MHGVLLLDKPRGLSSNNALQKAKWLLRAEKAAEAEAKKNNWAVTIAIVDDGGHLLWLQQLVDQRVDRGDPAFAQQAHHALNNGARAPHGRVHAPSSFEGVDQGIGRCDRERVATNQQGVEAHDRAKLVIAKVFGHQGVNAAPSPHA